METLRYLVAIFAAVAAAPMVVYLLPFSIDKRANPLVVFLSALVCLALPPEIMYALAMTIPISLISNFLGVSYQGHIPVKLPDVPVKDLKKYVKVPKKTDVREFIQKAYPDPTTAEKFVPPLV